MNDHSTAGYAMGAYAIRPYGLPAEYLPRVSF